MRRIAQTSPTRVWHVLLALTLLTALLVTWPWWYTWLLWRQGNTSWVQAGPGVDSVTYAVTNETEAGPARIPKIIHQTWKDENIPVEWRQAQASCRAMHPDFQYRLWTDAQSREFIAAKFPELLPTWDSYPFNIQRADAIRYIVLQEFGGYYIDLDIECVRPLDFLARYPIVLPKTWPVGLSNDFLAAEPGHGLMRAIVAALPRWNRNFAFKYPTVMFSTGPMLVTLKASFFSDRRSLWILTDKIYNKYTKGAAPLFRHLYGSSWHGDDAKSVLWILHHPVFLAVITLTAIVGGAALCWRRLLRMRLAARKGGGKPHDSGSSAAYVPLTEITTVKSS